MPRRRTTAHGGYPPLAAAICGLAAVLVCVVAFAAAAQQSADPRMVLARAVDPLEESRRTRIDPWASGGETAPPKIDLEAPPAEESKAKIPILPAEDELVHQLIQWLTFQDDDYEPDFAELTQFIAASSGWPRMSALIVKAERSITSKTPTRQVLNWFENHRPRTFEGSVAYAEALLRNGEESRATKTIRRSWIGFDMNASEERDFLARFGDRLEAADHAARLDRLLWDRRVSAAKRQADRVGQGRQALADARLRLMRLRGGVDNAVNRIPDWLSEDPGLVYERVRWRRRKDMTGDAAALLLSYRGAVVRPSRWWLEREILARRLLLDGDPATAYKLVRDHGLADKSKRADAEFLAGWIALRFLNDPHTAFGHFSSLYEFVSYPISRARGAYWAGRASEAAGEVEIAEKWYRTAARHGTTFYGQLAAHRIGLDIAPPVAAETEVSPKPGAAEAFDRDPLVRIVRLLIHLKAANEAAPDDPTNKVAADSRQAPMAYLAGLDEEEALVPFLRHIAWRSDSAEEWVLAAKLAREADRMEVAVYIARRAARDQVVLRDLGYPTMVISEELSPDPALLHALVRQESAFDPQAQSRVGARGLMQLMPATARNVARKLKLEGHSTRRLTEDPYHNLVLGSAYLDSMLTRFDGSMVMALAAYNAGPHRVKKWLEENGDPRVSLDGAIDWIESIPFSETRNYVQRILETLPIYRWKLRGEQVVVLRPADLVDGLPGYGKSDSPE